MRRGSIAAFVIAVALGISCGGSDDSTPTVTFEPGMCEYRGPAEVESGFVPFTLQNPTSNPAEAIVGRLEAGTTPADLQVSVEEGAYDRFGLSDWTDPGQISATPVRMPPGSADGIEQTVPLTSGDWAVICLDVLENRAVLAADGFSVAG